MSPKVVLITGGARRIGAVIAEQFHHAGYRVFIHAHRSKNEANALCERFNQTRPHSAQTFFADLADPNTPTNLINAVIDWAGQLDCLVHNASQFIPDHALSDLTRWQTLFTINVQTPYFLSQVARPHLAKQRGSMMYITDIHAHTPLRDYSVYCQTKAALHMQMLSLAKSFAPDIRVNGVEPGAMLWPEGENTLSTEIKHKIIQETPLQTHGDPQYIAQAILALVENPFITGASLKVDGGRSLS